MIHVVVNTKGGVGKSTASIQVLSAYLSLSSGGTGLNFVEIDDENKSVNKFSQSSILSNAKIVSTEMLDEFIENSVFQIDDLIIDVGGNKTATMFLNELKKKGGFLAPATYYIPLLDGDQDAMNAEETFKLIREFDKDSRIIYVLNRAVNKNNVELLKRQFIFFFGEEVLDIEEVTKDNKTYYVALNNNDVYKIAGKLQKTIYELSKENHDKEFKEVAELYWEDRNNMEVYKRLRKLQKLKDSANESKELVRTEYANLFSQLDDILGA